MSIYTKLFAAAGIVAMASAMSIATPTANASISAPLTSSNSSYTYCTWPTAAGDSYTVSDVEAAKQIASNATTSFAYFYVAKNTSTNVVDGKCKVFAQLDFVPYVSGHKTTFDLSVDGYPINVKVNNKAPEVKEVICDGDDTIVRFMDAQEDKLTVSSVAGANDFNNTSTNESNNVLKVKFTKINNDFTGSNNASIFVTESFQTSNLDYGYRPILASGSVASNITNGQAEVNEKLTVSKLNLTLKAKCDSSLYAVSSSSMMASSSMAATSAAAVASSTTTVSTSNGAGSMGGKGMLTRTGGAN
jgi:hypothetical protein